MLFSYSFVIKPYICHPLHSVEFKTRPRTVVIKKYRKVFEERKKERKMHFALKIFLFLIFFNALSALTIFAKRCYGTRTVLKTMTYRATKEVYVTRSHMLFFIKYERQTRYYTYTKVTIRFD